MAQDHNADKADDKKNSSRRTPSQSERNAAKRRYIKAVGIDAVPVPDGYVIYDEERGQVIYLNRTAAAFLEMCDGEHSVDAIATIVAQIAQLPEKPLQEMLSCVDSLLSQSLIVLSQR